MHNETDNTIDFKGILQQYHTIAVVGLSAEESRASHAVPRYLQAHGYRIIPINPKYAGETILGEKVYRSLAEARQAGEPIDIVEVFRRPADTVRVGREAVEAGAKVVWLQLGITNEETRHIVQEAGILFVQDHCMKVEHTRAFGS